MAFIYTNPNPKGRIVGDCTVRALAVALDKSWDKIYDLQYEYGKQIKDMENATHINSEILKDNGFSRHIIPDTCPSCYTIWEFCEDHPEGIYVLGTGSHVVAVKDGNYYDTWDSGDEVPIMYWRKE